MVIWRNTSSHTNPVQRSILKLPAWKTLSVWTDNYSANLTNCLWISLTLRVMSFYWQNWQKIARVEVRASFTRLILSTIPKKIVRWAELHVLKSEDRWSSACRIFSYDFSRQQSHFPWICARDLIHMIVKIQRPSLIVSFWYSQCITAVLIGDTMNTLSRSKSYRVDHSCILIPTHPDHMNKVKKTPSLCRNNGQTALRTRWVNIRCNLLLFFKTPF